MGEVTPITRLQAGPKLSAPTAITSDHDVTRFDCGKPALTDWLREKSLKNEGKNARCYVVCEGPVVVGYYCLAASSVERDTAPSQLARNAPKDVPTMLIGRLAVDRQYQGQRIGEGMLKDALQRILTASKLIGARAVIVHAKDDEAVLFYKKYGFESFPTDHRTMFLPMSRVAASLPGK